MNQNIKIDTETGEVLDENRIERIDVSSFNNKVENTLYRNDILVSRKTEIRTGKLFKETIYKKGKGKIKIKKNLPIEIYGGYLNMETSFLVLVKYNNKTKIVGIPIEIALKVKKEKNELMKYLESHLETQNIEIINDKIPYETLIFIKEQPIYIKGYSVQKRTCELSNALQLKIKKEKMIKWKYALNRLFNDNKNINEYSDELYIKNLKNIENELYENKTQYPLFKNAIQQIEDNFKEKELKIEDYETIIRELFKL